MHRSVLLISAALVYYAVATAALVMFDAGILITSVVLFGVPAYLLARLSAAPVEVLTTVAVFGGGLTILLEGVAHIYGIWYTLGVDELRLFGLIPLEVIIASIPQTLFLVLLYELMFDDGEYSTAHISSRFIAFGVFFAAVVILIGLNQFIFLHFFFEYSYLWILIILTGASLATLCVVRSLSLQFFDRLLAFSVYASIPLLISLGVGLVNVQKIFAYTHEYIYTATIFGEKVPLEAIASVFVLPVFIATVYELYLDDRL